MEHDWGFLHQRRMYASLGKGYNKKVHSWV